MNRIPLLHHGGRHPVTGSGHELRLADKSGLLIDCGLFQGEGKVSPEIDFAVARLRALVLSHVHNDHCGRLPYLIAADFNAPIYCRQPSALLLPEILDTRDSTPRVQTVKAQAQIEPLAPEPQAFRQRVS